MAQPSIVPVILRVLEPYLENAHREFLDTGGVVPTLPSTTEGKVNVRQIVRDLMQRDSAIVESHEQHFFRKKELYELVDSIALEQGLKVIGSRSAGEEHDAARRRIGKLSREVSELHQTLAEREALIESLRRAHASLCERIGVIEETGMVFRTGDAK